MTISNHTLVKIAAIGGMVTVSMGFLARNKIQDNIRKSSIYKEALKTVRTHPGAVHLLGEPIKDKSIKNYCKDNEAEYEVSLKGPKDKGTLFFKASKLDENASWNIEKIELEANKHPDKKLIIKNVGNKPVS